VVVTGEIDRNESNPFYYLFHESGRRVWWKYPSRKDPLGNRQTVLKATVAQMKTIQERYYVPNNSLLVVTGDVKPEDVFAQAATLFAGWKRGADPFVKFPPVQHPPLPQTSVVLVEQPVNAVNGSLVWHGPSVKPEDLTHTYAADLLAMALEEPSSKFQHALVDSGACLSVYFAWSTQLNVGPVTANFQATPDKADACITAIVAELQKVRAPDYLSDEELANAGFKGEMNAIRERETPSQLAHVLSFWWTSAGLDYYLGYVNNLKKATRPQMGAFLDQFVVGKPYVLTVMVSPEAAKRGLDLAHFEKLIGAKPWKEPKASAPVKGEVRR
jgi:zinc protease